MSLERLIYFKGGFFSELGESFQAVMCTGSSLKTAQYTMENMWKWKAFLFLLYLAVSSSTKNCIIFGKKCNNNDGKNEIFLPKLKELCNDEKKIRLVLPNKRWRVNPISENLREKVIFYPLLQDLLWVFYSWNLAKILNLEDFEDFVEVENQFALAWVWGQEDRLAKSEKISKIPNVWNRNRFCILSRHAKLDFSDILFKP